MTDRYYFPRLGTVLEGPIELDMDETRHAVRARRHRVGDRVEVFDGLGRLAVAVVLATPGRGPMRLEPVERVEYGPAPRGLHIACAVPKGDRVETLLDMATQLGVAGFTPLRFERSVRNPGAGRESRWRRVLVEAAKQSRRLHLPTIDTLCDFDEWLSRTEVGAAWLADPGAEPLARPADLFAGAGAAGPMVIVGPEGGLTDAEVELARKMGCRPLGLGSHVLRVETAAVAAAALAAAVPAADR